MNKELMELAEIAEKVAQIIRRMAEETTEEAPEPAPASKECTLEEVRAVLADKSRSGLTDKVRELIKKYGADRLPDVDPSKYAALKAEAEGLT